MAKAAILLSLLALVCVGSNLAVGLAIGYGWVSIRGHFSFAVPSTVLALFAWTVVIFYFIGAVEWVKEAVEERRAAAELTPRAQGIRRAALPWIGIATVLLIAAYVVGGGTDRGSIPASVHLGLAITCLFAHLVACYRTIVFVGMMLDLQAEVT